MSKKKLVSRCLLVASSILLSATMIETSTLTTAAANEDVTTTVEQMSLVTITGAFSDYIPYSQFNNYQYSGFGMNYDNQYTILEYPPDENGRFQIVFLINGQAVACVYQQRSGGLFELARFEDYGEVQDLRYAPETDNGLESLVFSSNLSIGYQYYTGYNQELLRTVRGILPEYEKNGVVYREVIVIEETGTDDGASTWYYLAPKYGIICIEKIDTAGNRIAESSLYEVYNTVYE